MGYVHIENLRKNQRILDFKRCYALEKIHGTSAHVSWKDGQLKVFSGGEDHARFSKLFDVEALTDALAIKFPDAGEVVFYGEAYGGKQQGMSATYGKELKFVVFDVRINEAWLKVPSAFECAKSFGFEFVDFAEIPAEIDAINAERDKPSAQAVRNGIVEPKIREGVVLRPPFEIVLGSGRIIAKHKREEFSERGSPKLDDLDPTRRERMENAAPIAEEWVTSMRLTHVIDRLISERENKSVDLPDIPSLISLMVEDVTREGSEEITDVPAVRKAIGTRTVMLFKKRLSAEIGVAQ